MAFTYPAMHGVGGECTDVHFCISQWTRYYAIYCPICKKEIESNNWKKLIRHENWHMWWRGLDKHDDKSKKSKELREQALVEAKHLSLI